MASIEWSLYARLWTRFSPSLVVSYPKSGRTWLRVLISEAGHRVPFSHGGSSEERAQLVEELRPAVQYWRGKRILFMIRDPRDTLVSSWFQATRRSRLYDGTLCDYLRDARWGLEKIVRFHLLWLEAGYKFRGFAVLSYETLLAETESELRRALLFLTRRDLPPEAVRIAVAKGSFERMRELERSGRGRARFGVALTPGNPNDVDSFKVRRGIAGGWRDYLRPEDAHFAETIFARHRYRESVVKFGVRIEG